MAKKSTRDIIGDLHVCLLFDPKERAVPDKLGTALKLVSFSSQ